MLEFQLLMTINNTYENHLNVNLFLVFYLVIIMEYIKGYAIELC